MKETSVHLKAMAFEVGQQLSLLRKKHVEILTELALRDELIKSVEVTPDELRDTNTK